MPPSDDLHLACLCAAWCRLCDGYRPVFDAVVAALRREHPQLQAHWIDIEDEAALLGDLDIETFPTLVLARSGQPLFAGVLTPQAEVLQRVLRAALAGGGRVDDLAAVQTLVRNLRQRTPQAG